MLFQSNSNGIREIAKKSQASLPGRPFGKSISHWIRSAFRPWLGKSGVTSRGWKTGLNGEALGSHSQGGVFQALAGNGQPWKTPSHPVPNTVSLESLEDRTVPAMINWDGGAGSFNWADAANWDTDQMPGSGDQVNIPELSGDQVISINTNVTIESIQSAEGLKIQDFNFSLTKGASKVSGPFSMKNGNLLVVGESSTLTISNTDEILGSSLAALTGAKIDLPGLTTATNIRLSAEGAGSLISLSSLTEIKSNYAATGYTGSVFARFGGTIDLPNLKGITFATPIETTSYDEAGIVVWDTDSSINLPNLSDLSGVDTIRAEYGGSLSLPSVTSWAPQMANRPTWRTMDVAVYNPYETKSILSFPNLSMIEAKSGSFSFNANGNASIGLPLLVSATENGANISFTLAGSNSSIKLPGLTSVSSFDFSLQGGKNTLELPNVTTANQASFSLYDNTLNLPVLVSATGANIYATNGSTISVPVLASANGADFTFGDGSKIDLVGLTTPTNLRLTSEGAGSLISLPNVTQLNSNYAEIPYTSRLGVRTGGAIDLPQLVAISFATPEGTTSYDETDIVVQGINSSLNLAKLADLSGVDSIRVESGGSLSLPSVTTWAPQMVNRPSWRGLNITAYNTGNSPTELNFPNLGTLEAKAGSFSLSATGYSSIGLPVLSKATENGGEISFYLSEQKASIKLPGITSVNSFDFSLQGGKNTLDLPNVITANQASFNLTDYSLTIPALVNANQTRFTAYTQSTLDVPLLTSADGADFGFSSGSKMSLVGLTTPTNLRLSADGSGTQITLPNVTQIKSNYAVAPNTARLVARLGGLLDLPNLTGIAFATPEETTSYDETDIVVQDLGSLINVPKLSDLSGVDAIRAENGGAISLPAVTSIAYQMANRPSWRNWEITTYEPANVNGQGALISFPNLSSVEAKAGSFFYSATGKSTIDLPKLIMATESGGEVRFNETGRDATIKLPLLDTANGVEFTLYDRSSLSLPKLAEVKRATFSTYAGSMLHLDALTAGTNVRFRSENLGSSIGLPVLATLKNDSSLSNELALEAIGGAIDLPVLASVVREGSSIYGGDIRVSATGTIQAPLLSNITGIDVIQTSLGAKLFLPTVTQWTTPNFDTYDISLYSDDPGSLLELPSLASITHANTLGYQFLVSGRNGGTVSLPNLESLSKTASGIININPEGGGHVALPKLKSANHLTFNLSGLQSSINLAKLETAHQSTFNAHGGFNLNLPGLLSVSSSTFNAYSASSISANKLSTGTNLSLRSENANSLISLSSLANLNRDGNLPLEVSLEAINGTIQLPALTTISRVGTSFHGGDITVREKGMIHAPILADISGIDDLQTYHGGKLSLPGMVTWTTPNFDSNETNLNSHDPASLLEFPNLTSIVHANTQASQFLFSIYNGGTLSFPKLTTLSKTGIGAVNLNLDGGNLKLPALASLNMISFSLNGNHGSIDLGNLESVNQTTFNTHGGFLLNLPSLVSAKSSNFKAFSGSEVMADGLIVATNVRLWADGAGSTIGMSKLTTLQRDPGLPEDLALEAIGGKIDLPSLTTTTRVGQSAGAGYFQVQGIGNLSAPVLTDLSGIDFIRVNQRGHLSLPGVTSWTTPNFDSNPINLYSDDSGSLLEFPNLTSIKHANPLDNQFGLNARSGGTMEFPNLVSVVDSSAGRIAFISQIAEQISIPLLIDKSGIEFEFTGGYVNPTIEWTGGAGNFNFTDAANWDLLRVPGASDDVVIPDLPGDQSITINENASIRSINSAEGLLIPNNRYLDLSAGKSQINGEFKIDQGILRLYSGAQFTASNTVNLTAAYLEAQAGSIITISGLTSATNLGLHSSGKGSSIALTNLITIQRDANLSNEVSLNALGGTISLPALTGITRAGNSFHGGDIRIQGTGALHVPVLSDLSGIDFLQVQSGGQGAFPSVTTLSTPAFDSYETVLYADDPGSRLEFPNLAKMTHADTQGYQLRLGARNGGTLSFPKLTKIVRETTAPIS